MRSSGDRAEETHDLLEADYNQQERNGDGLGRDVNLNLNFDYKGKWFQ